MRSVIPDAALDADVAILGKKGRGKTYAANGLVEKDGESVRASDDLFMTLGDAA